MQLFNIFLLESLWWPWISFNNVHLRSSYGKTDFVEVRKIITNEKRDFKVSSGNRNQNTGNTT